MFKRNVFKSLIMYRSCLNHTALVLTINLSCYLKVPAAGEEDK
jgi:hypothetical protein